MKKRQDNNNSTAVNQGFLQQDQNYLRKYDNAASNPDVQILDEEDWEDENKEQRHYWCAICEGKLDYLKNMDMWFCSACVQYYDTKIQDVPIKNLSESKVKPFPELHKYPTYEENDIYMSFVQGIDPDEYDSIPRNVEVLRDDGRIKHIKVKGLPTEALAAMNDLGDSQR